MWFSVYNATLRESLAAGLIDKAGIDLAMRRVLLSRFKVGEFDVRPSVNPYLQVPHSVANSAAHIQLAYEAALQGMVRVFDLIYRSAPYFLG